MSNLTFNILTFDHPSEDYTLHFTDQENENLFRVHHKLVPDEVLAHYDEQEHFYISFDKPIENGFSVTKKSSPSYEKVKNAGGEEYSKRVHNSCFSSSILKRYYNYQIQQHFKSKDLLVKPNFIDDIEIWIPNEEADDTYTFYDKYTVKVQFATVTKELELLITYAGRSKVFNQSVDELLQEVSPTCFNWVLYQGDLFRYEELPDEARRNLEQVYPVWNFDLRIALNQTTPAPDRGNRYRTFKYGIHNFIEDYINQDDFKQIIPIHSPELVQVEQLKIGAVSDNSNLLLFGERKFHNVPYLGMDRFGPYGLPEHKKIHFFVIAHKSNVTQAKSIMSFFDEGLQGKRYKFNGVKNFAKIPYHTEKGFSIIFDDLENPMAEITQAIEDKKTKGQLLDDVAYMAIYISPFVKDKATPKQKAVYYRMKEYLLKKNINSQVIDAAKVKSNDGYVFSLNNIAIALLAKLQGEPWRLDRKLKNELIIGVGAFRHVDTDIQYIGSAFSFQNNGQFNYFDCFQRHQTTELAGSILQSVKDFYKYNSGIKRLIIHFFKNMSRKELEPIEEGLRKLDLDIPVFIVSINKTESHDIVAFDESWDELMPTSGTFINIGWNKYLLFNNTRYKGGKFNGSDGYPFPVKIKITCTDEEQGKDPRIIKELIDQVYQFSRMYWKSVRQQNLPVTIKYPEMVAEMFPYFDGNEIPDFGKDKLWFL